MKTYRITYETRKGAIKSNILVEGDHCLHAIESFEKDNPAYVYILAREEKN